MENMEFGMELPQGGGLLRGLYRMPASQSSSTSSHMIFVYAVSFSMLSFALTWHIHAISDYEAVVDEYLSHYKTADSEDLVRTVVISAMPMYTP